MKPRLYRSPDAVNNYGRIYRADAIVLPARGDKDMTVPSRFDQTIRFPPDGRFPDKPR